MHSPAPRWSATFAFLACLLAACDRSGAHRPSDTVTIGARADDYVNRPDRSQLGLYPVSLNICEPLVRLAADYSVQPLLATRWEYRGNNTWRFHLRPGVRFSNGEPLTSEAVRWTIAVAARREPHTFLYADSIRIIDALTVDLTPRQTNFRLIDQLVHPSYGILAPGSEPSAGPIGTGPFKFAGYRREEWIAATRNDKYWGVKARVGRLVFRFLPDETTRVLSLDSGAVDMILDAPRAQAQRLSHERGLRVVSSHVGRVASLFLNRRGSAPYDLLKDIRLRRAIAHAIDRERLVRDVWGGYGQLVSAIGPPGILGSFQSGVTSIPYDPSRAAALLDSAGWRRGAAGVRMKGGRALELTLIAWPEFDIAVLEFLQGQLAAAGVRVRIVRFADQVSYDAQLNRGAFDLDLEGGSQNDADPMFLPTLRFYSKSPIRSTPYFVMTGKFDDIIVAGLNAMDRTEVQRRAAQAMRMIVDEDVVAIPLAGLGRMYALRDVVTGFVPHPSQLNQQWSGLARRH
ncbi:MAG: ABC transporter substrate-binding protein [Thermoanaerobaculia bacterium]